MGEGAEEWRAETERGDYAQEANDVSRFPEEDCGSAESAVGEGKGGEEVGLIFSVSHGPHKKIQKPFRPKELRL
jgi:hypothetical protein